ncbi:uncharacterized protein LOC135398533 [Ornithodoros turicata]|uniref:uncharacterized protein LOC135398533 n=1 Tax=Ornithodoros turicata TaxID=34597 RepID=UPI00313A3AA3
MLQDLVPLKDKVCAMSETLVQMESSLQVMSDKYDQVLSELSHQKQEIGALQKRVDKIEHSAVQLSALESVKRDLNDLEQYGRRNNLEIHGIPYAPNESLLDKLSEVAAVLNVPQPDTNSIEAIHRLPFTPGKIPAVIVRFTNRSICERWLANRSKLRTHKIHNQNIYVNENLTASNRKLFYDARMRAKDLHYKFVWHKYGAIYVRKDESAKPIRVSSTVDLNNLV